jgi:predicted nucleic acid-binding protein
VSAASPSRILVPDASVGIKWYVPEPDAEAAARLFDPRFALHVPAYFFTEAASVLQRKAAVDRTLSEAEALNIHRLLRTVPLTIHATDELLDDAFRHAIRYRRPVYDSFSLVLAAALGGQVVTSDGRLYRGVQGGPLAHLVLRVTDPL